MTTNQEMIEKLDELERRIELGSCLEEARSAHEWGGADVIISSSLTASIRSWADHNAMVLSSQATEPRRRVLITPYSRELSWLLQELGSIFSDRIDHVSKYDFYGLLAQGAIDYVMIHKDGQTCQGLLKSAINVARGFCTE